MFGLGGILNEYTILIGVLLFVIYKWSVSSYDYFEKSGIPFSKPIPFFGSNLKITFARENIYSWVGKIYSNFSTKKVYGVFEMRKPILMVRDPDLIKQLTVKNFEHFLNHRAFFDEHSEPIFGRNLFAMKDQRWKDMRATLSPVFTGSKMREMFDLINEVSDRAMAHLREETKSGDISVDSKDITSRFTNDVIASTAFGLEIDSFKNKTNEFFAMGKLLSFGDIMVTIKLVFKLMFPQVSSFLKIRLFPVPLTDRFSDIIVKTMDDRAKSGIVRRDVIQLLMQARKGSAIQNDATPSSQSDGFAVVQESLFGLQSSKVKWNLDDLVAQSFVFFFAGFENVASMTCFTIQELIENPEIQQRLYEEVEETNLELNGKQMTYDVIQKMTYLDQVICETLRKWPPAPQLDRVCTKPFVLDVDGKSIPFKVGDGIMFPVYGMHHDPEWFENPGKFDPSRFSNENKHNVNPFVYMPFGVGPRNCIASRFALMEAKAIIYALVTNFELLASEKTQIPLKLSQNSGFVIKPEKGFWAKLKARK